ncbi:ankyrin repeat domain-containing protein 23-like [Clytia hemisphaerica]|uniref:ankyrin repeat domain-containing protein 23-like n=1 Tax=Clytia hemisphaerica TaxID=252671 RepID=UPI0034D74FD6
MCDKKVDGIKDRIFKACQQGHLEVLKELLNSTDLDLDHQFDNGTTCLHEVVIHNCQYYDMVKLLLEHGASVNMQDSDGNTPLHSAVLFHCVENVKELLKYNPNIYTENCDGATAVDFARNISDDEVERLLTGTVIAKSKTKNRRARKVTKSVNSKVKSFLPTTPIMSPSILKKRKLLPEQESVEPPAKRSCVRFADLLED